ncbi:MAG: cadherin-like beta sandwich domain-containing protein, partial [Actinomycetes bacterium]
TGTSGGVARWTGSSWQGIGRNAPVNVNAVVADTLYNGTDSRILVGSPSQNIGGVAAADGLAALAVSAVSTLDSVTVSSGAIAPAFDPAVVNYTVSLPNSSPSLAFTALASASGAPIVRSFSLGTAALDADTDVTINVAEGATETVTFLVTSVSGTSSTTYTFAVTRAAATTTSAAPTTATPTTAAPTTAAPTTAPPSTVGPQNTSPATTQAPETTAAATTTPPTAAAGSGSSAVEVSVAPVVSAKKAATGSAIAKYAKITVAAGSRVSLKVASSSARYCKVSGTMLKGVKAGSCRVTVTVTPKKGKAVSRTVTLKVT